MKQSPRIRLVLLTGGLLILGIVSAAWWTGSPRGVRNAGEAILLIAGAASAMGHVRRVPSATPAVLYTTVIAGLVVIARPGGPLLPIILSAVVALAWAAVSIAQSSAVRNRLSWVSVVFAQKVWTRDFERRTDPGPGTDLVPSTLDQGLS
jgi:hypothetical protein